MANYQDQHHDAPFSTDVPEDRKASPVPILKDIAQNQEGVGEGSGPKEYPKGRYIGECKNPTAEYGKEIVGNPDQDRLERLMDSQTYSMHSSPEDEFPSGSVPKATDEHGEEIVEIGSECAFPIASQGDVDIVAQP